MVRWCKRGLSRRVPVCADPLPSESHYMNSAGRRSVVITGAATGIGAACARRLAEAGWRVFAGVLDERQAERTRRDFPPEIIPVVFDITDPAAISGAQQEIERLLEGQPLGGLVNNAGVAITGPVECVPIDSLRRQFEVNLIGQVAVTQAFLPQLRASQGRLVNIASLAARVPTPLMGPYCASKNAMMAISDAMRQELRLSGIHVSCVEPAVIDTPILHSASRNGEALYVTYSAEARERYRPLAEPARRFNRKMARLAVSPDVVAEAVAHALTARRPRTRYVVGGGKWGLLLLTQLPDRLRDWFVARRMR